MFDFFRLASLPQLDLSMCCFYVRILGYILVDDTCYYFILNVTINTKSVMETIMVNMDTFLLLDITDTLAEH